MQASDVHIFVIEYICIFLAVTSHKYVTPNHVVRFMNYFFLKCLHIMHSHTYVSN